MELLISLMSFSLRNKYEQQAPQLLVVLGSGKVGGPRSTRSHKGRTDGKEGSKANHWSRQGTHLYCV